MHLQNKLTKQIYKTKNDGQYELNQQMIMAQAKKLK